VVEGHDISFHRQDLDVVFWDEKGASRRCGYEALSLDDLCVLRPCSSLLVWTVGVDSRIVWEGVYCGVRECFDEESSLGGVDVVAGNGGVIEELGYRAVVWFGGDRFAHPASCVWSQAVVEFFLSEESG
jgi:hypothetical protein